MAAPIKDEFSGIASRQRRYQLRRAKAGICKRCPQSRLADSAFCEECRKRHNKEMKFRYTPVNMRKKK